MHVDCSIRVYLPSEVTVLLESISIFGSGIMLDAFIYLLCSKLCWHNRRVPNNHACVIATVLVKSHMKFRIYIKNICYETLLVYWRDLLLFLYPVQRQKNRGLYRLNSGNETLELFEVQPVP